jgi:hypothetical protein
MPIVLAIVLAALLGLAAPAGAAQRSYRVTGGTTTVTFYDAWLAVLSQSSVQFAGIDGAKVTAQNRKDGPPIVRATFAVRRARGNIVVYGASGGPSVTAKHRGGLAFSSLSRPGTVSFRRVALVTFPGFNRLEGDLPAGQGDRTAFLASPKVQVGKPRGGHVRIVMRDVTWNYTGWMVFGATPDAPPTDNPWFPKAAMNAVVGDVVTVLSVRPRG